MFNLLQHTDYNKRPAEEQVYAEPILVNHPVNVNNPLGRSFHWDRDDDVRKQI